MKKDKRAGFTLLELLIGICILVVLGAVGFVLIRQVSQRTKVVVAKVGITQNVVLLDVVKADANYYPPAINETLESLTYAAAPTGYARGWRGPYLKATPIDPWGTPYFYNLIYEDGTIFGPTQCFRSTPPVYQDFLFTASGGAGKIILDNFELTACSVILNGVEVITEDEFKMADPRLEKAITLLPGNNVLSIKARSNKTSFVIVGITNPLIFGNRTSYITGSFGSDKKAGGTGFAKDLTWVTGQTVVGF